MQRVYPYPMQDDLTERAEKVSYRALHIENDYLHLIVLPELGGHVYSLFDKISRREVFYRNNVVKYGLVARRAAWISGGLEFNFPQGHSCVTVSPVMSRIVSEPGENAASILVGCTDRVSRMRWTVELSLRDGEQRLLQRVILHNPTPMKQRYYFWSNLAMPATDDLHLVLPTSEVRTSHGQHPYPEYYGTDLSYYRNHLRPNDIFCVDAAEDFFGCYYEQQDYGMAHWSDHRLDFGKKFFTWGTADEGMIWVDLLTDDDGQYVELQAGRFVDQSTFEFLGPHQAVGWREIWYPVAGTGGFDYANYLGAVKLDVAGDTVRASGVMNMDMVPGELIVQGGGRIIANSHVPLGPGQPFSVDIPIEGQAPDDISLTVLSNQRKIIEYAPGAKKRRLRPMEVRVVEPADVAQASAEELCTKAVRHVLRDERKLATCSYEEALAKDPGASSAHLGLGILAYGRGLTGKAKEHLLKALERDRQCDEAWYYLALTEMALGNDEDSDEIMWWLAARSPCRYEARIALARSAVGQMRSVDALYAAVPDIERSLDAAFIVAVDRRCLGMDTSDLLKQMSARFPLAPEFAAERFLLAFDSENLDTARQELNELVKLVGAEPDEWLEIALQYIHCGREGDAVFLLRGACESIVSISTHPMVHYYIAYYADDDEREEALSCARGADATYCFPSRLHDIPVLRAAVERDPDDWHAHLYLGTLFAALDRREDAMAEWQAAARIHEADAVLCRNVGMALALWDEDYKAAIEWYDKAIVWNPNDHHLYIERDQALAKNGESAAGRLAVIKAAPETVLNRWDTSVRQVECLLELSRWDDAIALMRHYNYQPWEGERAMHERWTQAHVCRAADKRLAGDAAGAVADYEIALTYPRNLGVGRAAYPQEARVHWLLAEAAAEVGDEQRRDAHLQLAADEQHLHPCEADAYKARALKALGRTDEAREVAEDFARWAEDQGKEMAELSIWANEAL